MSKLLYMAVLGFLFGCAPGPKTTITSKDVEAGLTILGYRAPCAVNPNDLNAPEINDDKHEILMSDVLNNVYRFDYYDESNRIGYWNRLDKGSYVSTGEIKCKFSVTDGGVITVEEYL